MSIRPILLALFSVKYTPLSDPQAVANGFELAWGRTNSCTRPAGVINATRFAVFSANQTFPPQDESPCGNLPAVRTIVGKNVPSGFIRRICEPLGAMM